MKNLLIIFAVLCIVACEKAPIQAPIVNQNTNNYFAVNGLKLNVSRSWYVNNNEIGAVANDATLMLKQFNNDSITAQIILNGVLYYSNTSVSKYVNIQANNGAYNISGTFTLYEFTNNANKIELNLNFQTIKK